LASIRGGATAFSGDTPPLMDANLGWRPSPGMTGRYRASGVP